MSTRYNGCNFRDKTIQENTKYIVISDGDLDLNGAYGINSDMELKAFISNCKKDGSIKKIQAIFKIESEVEFK